MGQPIRAENGLRDDEHGVPRAWTIVVGFDESETSARAARYAVDLARASGGRVIFVQVLNTALFMAVAAAALPTAREAAQEAGDDVEKRLRNALANSGVTWELRRSEGNPFLELMRVAEAEQPDMVVVGASMRSSHRFVGSLPIHLVKAHRWPVTVVP